MEVDNWEKIVSATEMTDRKKKLICSHNISNYIISFGHGHFMC